MKRRGMLTLFLLMCLAAAVASAESAPLHSDSCTPDTVIYLPDFSGAGNHWELQGVSDDQVVHVAVTPIVVSHPVKAANRENIPVKYALQVSKQGMHTYRWHCATIVGRVGFITFMLLLIRRWRSGSNPLNLYPHMAIYPIW